MGWLYIKKGQNILRVGITTFVFYFQHKLQEFYLTALEVVRANWNDNIMGKKYYKAQGKIWVD